MKLACTLGTAISVLCIAWLSFNLRESRQQADHARIDHDALLVRIAVLQGQIDTREKEDRDDEELRLQQQKLREQDDFAHRWQPTVEELEAIDGSRRMLSARDAGLLR